MQACNKYHKAVLNSASCENIIALFSKTRNAHKEITESMAILHATLKTIPDIGRRVIHVIGDGRLPRTGILFAYFTKAQVYSYDPQFDMEFWGAHRKRWNHERITVLNMKFEDATKDEEFTANTIKDKDVVAVFPHSHADFTECIRIFMSGGCRSLSIVNMPCCVPIPEKWMEKPHIHIRDRHVISPKNDIYIWAQEETMV